ncbi:MAG: dienelactone hydrolase family protein [Candidatus Lokiarchaeota archaeon]
MKIIDDNIKIKSKDNIEIQSYIAHPQKEGKYPGLMIIHEIWGLNDQIKGVARRYAEEGYVVTAPHLFSRSGDVLKEENIRKAMVPMFSIPREKRSDPSSLQKLISEMGETEKKVVQMLFLERETFQQKIAEDAISCYEFLKGLDNINENKIGVTGFCFGAGLAFQLSTMLSFEASVIFYGANPKPLDSVSNIKGPVLALYAGEDEMVDAGIPDLIEAMLKYKKTYALKIYSGVQHAFFNETSSVYDQPSAKDAWQLVLHHFNTYLK